MTPAQLQILDTIIRDGRGLPWRDCEFVEHLDWRHRDHVLTDAGALRLQQIAERVLGPDAISTEEDLQCLLLPSAR